MRETNLSAEELIKIFESGKCTELLGHDCGCDGRGFLIHELGCCALEEKDKTAQDYLVGLLSGDNEVHRFFVFCYLLRIKDLEPGNAARTEESKKKKENVTIVEMAWEEISNQAN